MTIETVLANVDATGDTSASEESTDATIDSDTVVTAEGEGGVEDNTADSSTEESTTDNAVEGGDQSTSSETYADFVAPEGMQIDAQLVEQATPLFKELGLNQEQAQKLVDFEAARVQASQTGQAEAFNQLKQDWQDQAKSDKEIGGDKFDQSVSDAREALSKFGTPELSKLLNDFGIGNNPEMIRFMAKVGALTKEDIPGNTGGPSTPEKDRLSILYPPDS